MAISIFPSTAAEFVSNNFVIDMNDTNNNTADTGGVKQAGPYEINFASGDATFDVYFIDADGVNVGYSNSTSINATGLFDTVVILGVASSEIVSFSYSGSITNADGFGDQPGAGAFLTSISPTDLPSIDDTATVVGGNFGADTEITFESGATVLPAKSITVNSSTELLVTRPDGLIEDDAPYTLRAITTGVPQPTGSNANLLVDEVTAGSDPTFVTTSPLNNAVPGVEFTQTITATDEGTVTFAVVSGAITTGLSLSSAGVLSGTPTTDGNFTFTVTATDDGGNTTNKEFEQLVAVASGGTVTTDGAFKYHTFFSSDDFILFADDTELEYLVIAGGGGGGDTNLPSGGNGGGGGGAGGLLNETATFTSGTYPITVGSGGASLSGGGDSGHALVASSGGNSSVGSVAIAIGGGGGTGSGSAGSGGSGGGAAQGGSAGAGTAGQGFAGAKGTTNQQGAGGGGGAGGAGVLATSLAGGAGGVGVTLSDFQTQAGLTLPNNEFAKGGGGGNGSNTPGLTGGPDGSGGGAGGNARNVGRAAGSGDGIVMVRYSI